jgi:hypothetical protein
MELNEAVKKLIKLKIAIFTASIDMRENILTLSELKSKIIFLQGIDTKEGKITEYGYGDTPIEYAAVYDKVFVKEQVNLCEKKIDEIQDELDEFNHITEIEV